MDAARDDRLEELFEAALAVAPELRAAFLDDACAGDTELRARLAEVLTDAGRAYEFVDRVARPAIAQCADDMLGDAPSAAEDRRGPRVGEEIAHFGVLERLGGSGMGVVYKALDVRLGTTVAHKFLPARSSDNDEAKRRFTQEAKAASALDHPNICAIHEIGETAALGERGQVRIVDFGLAKMSGADLTREPRVMGTIAYMSPEQTYGSGVDQRRISGASASCSMRC